MIIELLVAAACFKGAQNLFGRGGGGGKRTPDSVDAEERKHILKHKNEDQSMMRRYLDHKRERVGFPRRAGVNADVLAPRNDAWWTTKPGGDGGY